MIVDSHNGKKVPILVLKDRWVAFCLPLLVLNAAVYLFYQILLRPYFFVLTAASERVLRGLSARAFVNIPLMMLINFASQAGLFWLSSEPGIVGWAQWLLVALNVVTTMMCLVAIAYTTENRFGVRTDLVFRLSSLDGPPASRPPVPWPKGLQVVELSRGIFLGSLLAAAVVLYNLGFIIASEPFSPVFWVSVHTLVLVTFLVNFEVIEHLAAHSMKGQVATLTGASLSARALYMLELLRKNIAWPLYFWLPNAYYFLHTYHHHIENNGPADWQSTIRFDQSSFVDFAKSLIILEFSTLFPLDTIRYFKAMNRLRFRRLLLLGCMRGYFLILVVILIEPFCAVVPMMLQLGRGWIIHRFNFSWHGFHDATRPYDVEASNNSDEHYAHHKKPGVHLFSEDLMDTYHSNSADSNKVFAIHKPEIGYYIVSQHWLLIQSLLWQRKFGVLCKLIDCDHLTDSELHRLVSGRQLIDRNPLVARIDRRISYMAGRVIELVSRSLLPTDQRHLLNA